MLLCLDVGNTHILGGIYKENQLVTRFRYATPLIGTSDQFGIFLTNILQNKQINPAHVSAVAVSSVVPSYDYSIRHTILNYFHAEYFVLRADHQSILSINYLHPGEVGADRIANAIGGITAFPDQNMIIVDMGTATTLCAVTHDKHYLGGAILPGMRLSMESLKSNTAKLMEVNIEEPTAWIGKTTQDSIQSGLFYGQLGALRELMAGFKQEAFPHQNVKILGTGGFAQLYKDKHLFDILLPDLVLSGLQVAYHAEKNQR